MKNKMKLFLLLKKENVMCLSFLYMAELFALYRDNPDRRGFRESRILALGCFRSIGLTQADLVYTY